MQPAQVPGGDGARSAAAPSAAQAHGWRLAARLFFLLVPASHHLACSWIGVNPADESFILALSRCVLEGEVPHRDFCFMRPAGSPMRHAVVLAMGRDRACTRCAPISTIVTMVRSRMTKTGESEYFEDYE